MLRRQMTAVMAIAVVGLLAGCAPDNPGRRQEAADLADRYLRAVSGGAPDRGWSLLYRSAREAWENEDEYTAAVEGADWSRFEFDVREAIYCDDGLICPVAIELANGPESVPEVLRASDNKLTDGIIVPESDASGGDAELWVINADFLNGPGGVLVGATFSR